MSAGTYSVIRSSASSGENLYRTGSSGALGGSLADFFGPDAKDGGAAADGFDMDDKAGFFAALAPTMAFFCFLRDARQVNVWLFV